MKKIIFTQADGSIAVIHPVINTIGEAKGFTEDDALLRAMKDIPPNVAWTIVDEGDVPTDRTNREAWVLRDGKITVDASRIQPKKTLNDIIDERIALKVK